VDLKTVHHWADRGKVPCFRTEGRHLRFRRNDVVRFLRAHGYPLPDALVRAKPTVALALPAADAGAASGVSADDLARRLASRFAVVRFGSAIDGVAHLAATEPDVLVVAAADPTIAGARTIAALGASPATAWIFVAAFADDEAALAALRDAGAGLALSPHDAGKLPAELARALAVEPRS
jgi:hypothetical protein